MPAEPQRRTLLVVDDDLACCRFVASKIHEETCLIPLVADSLAGAAAILSDKAVQVDALLSDLVFEAETSATASAINDGFDLLAMRLSSDRTLNRTSFRSFQSIRTRAREPTYLGSRSQVGSPNYTTGVLPSTCRGRKLSSTCKVRRRQWSA